LVKKLFLPNKLKLAFYFLKKMRLSSTSEEQKVHQQIATLAHDSVSTVASAAFVAFAKVADILQLEEEEDEDDEDDKGEGVPKNKKEGQRNDKRPLSRQFHWSLNQHAMEIISKEELDSIYRLFRFYDSSSYGDKLPSMSKNMFLQLLRDASMFDPPDFTEETVSYPPTLFPPSYIIISTH
jgi:hypothetical protein